MIRASPRILVLSAALGLAVFPVAAQDVPEGSPEAIAAFAEGMKHYVAGEYADATTLFEKAHELDKSFVVPLFMASLCEGNLGNVEDAQVLRERVWQERHRLSPYYQHRLEAQMAMNSGDRRSALRAARAAAELGPGTKAWYNLAYVANGSLMGEEALKALDVLDPKVEPMRDWYPYRTQKAVALHILGRHQEELAVARDAWLDFPERQNALYLQAQALGALGFEAELENLWSECMGIEPAGAGVTPGALMATAAAEAMAHGHPELGRTLYLRSVDWYETEGMEEASVANRNWYGFVLNAVGRHDDALSVFDGLLLEQPDNGFFHTMAGVLAAHRGDDARFAQEHEWLTGTRESVRPWWQATFLGYLAAAQGDAEHAVQHFQNAVDLGLSYQAWWHRDPTLLALADDPAFKKFMTPKK